MLPGSGLFRCGDGDRVQHVAIQSIDDSAGVNNRLLVFAVLDAVDQAGKKLEMILIKGSVGVQIAERFFRQTQGVLYLSLLHI